MIQSGEVTVAFRRWKRPTVRAKGTLLTPVGQLKIRSLQEIDPQTIKKSDSLKAGFGSLQDLQKFLSKGEGDVFRIEFELLGPDPRIKLRNTAEISEADFETLRSKLRKMDSGKSGVWTQEVLRRIQDAPGKRAQDLADEMSVEKDWLKTNIRKLKNLGLTISLEVGYKLSPRGATYLDRAAK